MSEADRLTLREQFDALRQPDLDDGEQVRRWLVVSRLAPTLLDSGWDIFVTVASPAVQHALGL